MNNHGETVWENSVADSKMKGTHNKYQRLVDQHGDEFEERAARRKGRYQDKQDNPKYHSRSNDCGDDCDLHNVEDAYDSGPVTTDVTEMAGTSIWSQLLQIRKKRKTMKCPPTIASDKMPRCQWEGKPMLVMKSTMRKMSRRNKDAPQDFSP